MVSAIDLYLGLAGVKGAKIQVPGRNGFGEVESPFLGDFHCETTIVSAIF